MADNSNQPPAIVLASTSPSRRSLLKNAGLSFSSMTPHVDERTVEAPYLKNGATPEFLAVLLSRAKALEVSKRAPGAYVIGGDQVMAFEGRPYAKPRSRKEAKEHLNRLAGKSHYLLSALAIVRDGKVLFEACEQATLHMRPLGAVAIENYLKELSDTALYSSGIYQLEGFGVRLFSRIDGDFFTILGMPMLTLLSALRKLGVIDD